jgi:phosphate transport system substrate-binding protein
VRITVGIVGTGGGFQRFCNSETDIQNASRPISASERAACDAKGIEFIEIPVAYDALSIVVHPSNDWAECITFKELKTIWEPGAQNRIQRWNQVRTGWPDRTIRLFGPGTDSGTFDYFTEVINGKAKDSRGDFTPSEDDNVLVQGVSGERGSLGYFGLAYFQANKRVVKALQVDGGSGCIEASNSTVASGLYPLSRPLFIYVRREKADDSAVGAFVDFYLLHAAFLAGDVGYVGLPESLSKLIEARWRSRQTGSIFADQPPGRSLEDLLRDEVASR